MAAHTVPTSAGYSDKLTTVGTCTASSENEAEDRHRRWDRLLSPSRGRCPASCPAAHSPLCPDTPSAAESRILGTAPRSPLRPIHLPSRRCGGAGGGALGKWYEKGLMLRSHIIMGFLNSFIGDVSFSSEKENSVKADEPS